LNNSRISDVDEGLGIQLGFYHSTTLPLVSL